MIKDSDKYKVINNLKSHTVTTINENKNRIFPIVITDKINVKYNEEYNVYATDKNGNLVIDSDYESDNSIEYDDIIKFNDVEIRVNFYNCNRYHYCDRWYSYTLSADNTENTFGIIRVTNLPYKNLYKRIRKDSFITRLDKMVFTNEIEPFLLFINHKFVKWDDINIIYDCGISYLILYGEKYNYFDLMNADISMIILPFKVGYIGLESQDLFNINYNAFKQYLNDNCYVGENGKLRINVPNLNTEQSTVNHNIDIGGWYYEQLKLKHLGLLPKERIDLLRSVNVSKVIKDDNDVIISTYDTTFNCFDRDSYDIPTYDSICDVSSKNYKDKAIFRFNDDGLLDSNGSNMIYMIDNNDIGIINFSSSDRYIYHSELDIGFILNRNNYLVFKNNLFYPEICDNLVIGVNNTVGIVNNKRSNLSIFAIYNKNLEYQFNNTLLFDKGSFDTISVDYMKKYVESYDKDIYMIDDKDEDKIYIHPSFKIESTEAIELEILPEENEMFLLGGDFNIPYMDKCMNYLDFGYDKNKLFSDNYKESLDYLVDYNPLVFNNLYKTNISSTVIDGLKANESLDFALGYETRHGLKIPRNRYKYHESYAMVFVNGELIETYSEMIVFPNYLFIPVNGQFNNNDQIEFLFFNNINNNELLFKLLPDRLISRDDDLYYDDELGRIVSRENLEYDINNNRRVREKTHKLIFIDKYDASKVYNNVINYDELKIFNKYPKNIMQYPTLVEEDENIAFNVSYRNGDDLYLIEDSVNGEEEVVACSSRKFIYQRLYVDNKAFRILIGKQFRYCDNQKQYMVFINGRKIKDDSFLITIPKYSRPFNAMYIYLTKFVNPEDRIEIFYVPEEIIGMNVDREEEIKLQSNGYIEFNKKELEVPIDNNLYLFFINGKKIPKTNLINVSTDTIRVNKDTLSTEHLDITPIYKDYMNEVKELLQSDNISKYEEIINYIKDNDVLGYNELDRLFNCFVQMSNIERDMIFTNVDRIAIINEIVRDFWVTSGYDYASNPFVYDYVTDRFITKDRNGNYILPSMDANPEINIPKIYELRFLYIKINGLEKYLYELGNSINNPIISWEYNANYSDIVKQSINDIDLDLNQRTYKFNNTVMNSNTSITLYGENEFYSIEQTIDIKFINGIYYGLIDEDALQYFNYKPNIPNRNNAVVDEYYNNNDLQRMMKKLTKSLQESPSLSLEDYIIGNNKYFLYAAPKRLLYDDNNNLLIKFYLPDINSQEVIEQNRDDKTTPIYTNGKFNNQNSLIKVNEMKMNILTEFNYTNDYNYTEPYVVFCSNGFFTRLFDNTGFDINVKHIEDILTK